jgi:hypothetical protein
VRVLMCALAKKGKMNIQTSLTGFFVNGVSESSSPIKSNV